MRYWQPILDTLASRFDLTESYDGEHLIAINHNLKKLYRFKNLNKLGFTILIRTEPPSVYPKQYSSSVEKKYNLIITPGGDYSLQKTQFCLSMRFTDSANRNKIPYWQQLKKGGLL